jgi:IMP dehydrogenase/GMP reductase
MNKEFIKQELESLIRSLDYIQEEQAFVKRKLNSFLENFVMNDFIIWAEDLQLQILNREAALRLLQNDILLLKKGVKASKSVNNIVEAKLMTEYKKYKLQVVYLENEFIAWKSEVNEKFEANVS